MTTTSRYSMDAKLEHLNPNSVSDARYKEFIDNQTIPFFQQANYTILQSFSEFCEVIGSSYFMIADGLQGAIVYHDFIPGKKTVEIGMLRADFLILDAAYQAQGDELPFVLSSYHDIQRHVHRTEPILSLREPLPVTFDNGAQLFDKEHMPYLADPKIRISIFDAYPNDHDTRKWFFFRMRLTNLFSNSVSVARGGEKISGKKLGKTLTKCVSLRFANNHAWKLAGKYNGKEHREVGRLLHTRSKYLPLDELLPVKEVPFGPISVPCPHDTKTWIEEDLATITEDTKKLQSDVMSILQDIDRVCRNNGIGYFICGGSMLGYVRNGGFIPWDDDMDIGMLRSDYNRFIACASNQLAPAFFLQTRESDPLIPYIFSKVRMRDSEYVTKYNKDREFQKGICVDIFPFDRVPDDHKELVAFKNKMHELSAQHNKVANHQLRPSRENEPARTPQAALARIIGSLQRRKYWKIDLAVTQKAYEDAAIEFNDCEDFKYVASFVPTFTMVNVNDLLPYQDVDFSGYRVMAPAHPEVFLQMQYGNYMQEPLPHQQRGHGLLWWRDQNFDSRSRDGANDN